MSTTEFWVVWNPSRGIPQVRHATQAEAEAEADRLAAKQPGEEFIVLRAESVTKVEVPKPTRVKLVVDGWILHDGKSNPDLPEGTMLHRRYRSGRYSDSAGTSLEYPNGESHDLFGANWVHRGSEFDVVAYRIVSQPKAEPEPTKIDHPWTDWVAGDVNKYPIPGDTKIIGRLRAGIAIEDLAKHFIWNELGGGGTLVAYKILEAAPEQKPADGEPKFIEWNGGENPAPGKIVKYVLRDGRRDLRGFPSYGLDWTHSGQDYDIVGYRVVGDDPDAEVPEDDVATDDSFALDLSGEEAPSAEDSADGWVEWSGSENTTPSGIVQVRFRDGTIATARGEHFSWFHLNSYEDPDDIVAYRYLDNAGSERAGAKSFEEVDGAEGLDSMSPEEISILNGIRRMRRHGIAYIETLQGPIDTSEGLIFPDQQLVENAKAQFGEAFDNLILAIAR